MCYKCRALKPNVVEKAIVLQTTGEVYIGAVKVYPCIEPEAPSWRFRPNILLGLEVSSLGTLAELFGVGMTVRKESEV